MASTWGLFAFLLATIGAFIDAEIIMVDWTVAWMTACPNGVCRDVIGVNGRWPPQTVWINQYDELILVVRNFLNDGECITVHTHGIDQPMANYYDGVDQVTQWYRNSTKR